MVGAQDQTGEPGKEKAELMTTMTVFAELCTSAAVLSILSTILPNPHNVPMRWVLLQFPFYRCRN